MSFPAPKRLPFLLLISAAVFALDRWSKMWVTRHVQYGGAIPIWDHVLRITHWTNGGMAFSLFAYTARPEVVRWALVCFASLAAIAVLIAMVRMGSRINVTTVALALILAGSGRQCARPHPLRRGDGLYRGAHLRLSLAGLQRGGFVGGDGGVLADA